MNAGHNLQRKYVYPDKKKTQSLTNSRDLLGFQFITKLNTVHAQLEPHRNKEQN